MAFTSSFMAFQARFPLRNQVPEKSRQGQLCTEENWLDKVKPTYRGTLLGKIVGTRNGQFFLVRWLTGRNTSNDSLNQIEKCFQAFFSFFGLLFLENCNFRGLSFWTIPHPLREVLKLLFIFFEKVDTILDLTPAILEIPRHRLYSRIISEKRKVYEILMPGKRKFPLPPTTTSIHLINLNKLFLLGKGVCTIGKHFQIDSILVLLLFSNGKNSC